MAQAIIARAEAAVVEAKAIIARAEAAVGSTSSGRAIIARAEVASSGAPDLGGDLYGVEPFSTVTLTATFNGTVTSWSFTQISGPPVTLTPSGNTVSFVAP